jgi:hypothetical protein
MSTAEIATFEEAERVLKGPRICVKVSRTVDLLDDVFTDMD